MKYVSILFYNITLRLFVIVYEFQKIVKIHQNYHCARDKVPSSAWCRRLIPFTPLLIRKNVPLRVHTSLKRFELLNVYTPQLDLRLTNINVMTIAGFSIFQSKEKHAAHF